MIRVLKQPVRREDVHASLVAEGFVRTFDPPMTGSRRTTEWRRGADVLVFSTNVESGLTLFYVLGPEQDACVALLDRRWPSRSAAQVVEEIATSTNLATRAGGALALRDFGLALRFDSALSRETLTSALLGMLGSNDELLQTAALEASFDLCWAELTAGVLGVTRAVPALAWAEETWNRARAREEAAALARSAEEAKAARLETLAKLVDDERWDEALSLSKAVFDEGKEPPIAAWRARSFALARLGRVAEAAAFAAGWSSVERDDDDDAEEIDELLADLAKKLPGDQATPLLDAARETLTARDDAKAFGTALATFADLVASPPAELDFAVASILLRASYERSAQKRALPHAERAARALDGHVSSAMLVALARAADEDWEGAEASHRKVLGWLGTSREETPRERALSRFDRKVAKYEDEDARVTRASVYGAMTRLHLDADRFDALSAVVSEALRDGALDANDRAELLHTLAMQATEAKRHEPATRHYRAAIEAESLAGKEPNGTLRFNLACELAKIGRGEEALPILAEAIAIEEHYADDARTDDYFESIWDSSAFIRIVAAWPEPPTREDVERRIDRTLGHSYRGEGEEALEQGHYAVSGAELLGDETLLLRALEKFGSALTYHASPARGIGVLERAATLARELRGGDASARARAPIFHALGAALHAAERFDEARAQYEAALADRIASEGEESDAVAISYGDLARLAMSREQHDEAELLMVKTIRILEGVVARNTGEDRWDALVNLSLVQGNRVAAAVDRARPLDEVLALADETLARLDAIVEAGARIPSGVTTRLRRAVVRALPTEMSDALSTRVNALASRILELEEPNPAVRAERIYWQNLRAACVQLKNQGHTDQAIAQAVSRAVRGENPGEPIAEHPAFRDLSVELANRLTARTDLVMVAMALDMASSGHEPIEKALESLQEFAIANALGEGGDALDDEDDE